MLSDLENCLERVTGGGSRTSPVTLMEGVVAVMLHESSLSDAADRLWEELPGHRVEILSGSVVVTPPPDGPHQETCFGTGCEFAAAGARKAGLRAVPGIGLWLPAGPDD